MPLYDKPVRQLMHDMVRELALSKGDVLTRDRVVGWFREHYPNVKESTVGAHLIRLSTNAPSRVHYSARAGDDDLFFQLDGSHFRLYDAASDPPPIREAPGPEPQPEPPPGSGADVPTEFAYESDLRNFLSKNLHLLEQGLRLYEEEGITGLEFPVGGRFIDILAVDKDGGYTVIELKVSRGYDRVVGQLLRYMGWVAKHHAEATQEVRGAIVARQITEDLVLACSSQPNVDLYEYQLSVALKKVDR